jgi:DNA mismatch repair ATPase MutL
MMLRHFSCVWENKVANDRVFSIYRIKYTETDICCCPFLYSQVTKVVNEVYHQFNQYQYPFVFLNLKMARDSVDVNVTPDKRQVFMDREKLLTATIKVTLMLG